MSFWDVLGLMTIFCAALVGLAVTVTRLLTSTVEVVTKTVVDTVLGPRELPQSPPEAPQSPAVFAPPWEAPWGSEDREDAVDADLEV